MLARYASVGRALTGERHEVDAQAIDAGLAFVQRLVLQLEIPGLSTFGLGQDDVAPLVQAARKASSMKYNPIELGDQALAACVQQAL